MRTHLVMQSESHEAFDVCVKNEGTESKNQRDYIKPRSELAREEDGFNGTVG